MQLQRERHCGKPTVCGSVDRGQSFAEPTALITIILNQLHTPEYLRDGGGAYGHRVSVFNSFRRQ